MRKCKCCGREFVPKSKVNVFCCKKCKTRYRHRASCAGIAVGSRIRCLTCGKEFKIAKGQSTRKCPNCIANSFIYGVTQFEKRELSSIQLWLIAGDVAKGRDNKDAAADFNWIGEDGVAVFESKLEEKRPEYDRYLEEARKQHKTVRCG